MVDSEGNERPLGRLEQLRYLIAFLELQVRDLFEAKKSLQFQIDELKAQRTPLSPVSH
jgi:chromosome segregation ATPase